MNNKLRNSKNINTARILICKCSNNVQCVHVVQYFLVRALHVLSKILENRPIMLA